MQTKLDHFIQQIKKLDILDIMWRKHALQRMLERSISRSQVRQAIQQGKIVETYFDDYPYPSCLIAHITIVQPLHVVLSIDEENNILYVITAYIPDENHFKDDLTTRKNNED